MEKYPSLADQNWQKSLEILQCERPRSRGKIPIARGSKLAKIAGNPTVRASPLAWKNTHRSRIKIGKNRRKLHSASVPARVKKYPSLADQNWQKSPEIAQCERPRSRERIAQSRAKINKNCRKSHSASVPARVEKYPSLAWKNTHRSRGKIPIEKYPSLAWKNTHRSRGKIPIARVEKYPSLAWKNQHQFGTRININRAAKSIYSLSQKDEV
ncbi:MAG: hypothetical protein JGK38_26700 [Microcoleus sp. PH2017_15_JOR_U_A]|uniref:hypothetical protein n=1 Tax=Microcoleus sp. PH2017_15_JOR_U_A TaxID=2798826 RepID=UPI001D90F918|nr:hypothetical protein [Microcoleus sp. PH2017_15_JOR_U_A]MCC3500137.1 hypothetical protein [Microcoleus sp. PH2017_15_JOR_U_A]